MDEEDSIEVIEVIVKEEVTQEEDLAQEDVEMQTEATRIKRDKHQR